MVQALNEICIERNPDLLTPPAEDPYPHARRIDVPSHCFSHIHLDLVGPLLAVRGFTHAFTIVDRSTRWPATYTD